MKKILLYILTACACILSSCTKESFPVDAYVGRYNLEGTAIQGKYSQDVMGTMDVYPTGKETFTCEINFISIRERPSFDGYIENGRMHFHPNKSLDISSSATMTDGDSESANIYIKIDHSVGTGHETVSISLTARKSPIASHSR